MLLKKNKTKSSTEKQSTAIIVHDAKRTATSTRTTHTRQKKPFEAAAVQHRRCPQLSSSLAVSAAVRTWCGGETSTSKRVRVLVTRCSSKNSKRNHQPKKRSLPSSSTKQSAQQQQLEQHTQGTTSPLKPLLSSSDGAGSCRIRLRFPLQFC